MNRRSFIETTTIGLATIAGCTQFDDPDTINPATPTASATPTSSETPSPSPTESPTPTPESPNPWGKDTLVVGVEQRVPARHDIHEIIHEALAYWAENAATFAGYDISYRYRPNSANPDIQIILVNTIHRCGEHSGELAGCAPLITHTPPRPAEVKIVDGYRKAWMVTTLMHEIGHTLGLGHRDEPAHIMSNQIEDRIPDYYDRRRAVELYAGAFDPYSKGAADWRAGISAWNDGEYDETEAALVDAHNHWVDSREKIRAAAEIAADINEPEAHDTLDAPYQHVELRRKAANAGIEMARAANNQHWDASKEYREQANDYNQRSDARSFDKFNEFVNALGFPLKN